MKRKRLIRFFTVIISAIMFVSQLISVSADDKSLSEKREIGQNYKWDLQDIYENQDEWENDFDKVQKEYIPKLIKYRGRLSNSRIILECFNLHTEMCRILDKLYVYAGLGFDLNIADSIASEMMSKAETLNSNALRAEAFIETELLSKSERAIKSYMNNRALKNYRYYFDRLLKKKKHTLTRTEEQLLSRALIMANAPNDVYNKATNLDIKPAIVKDETGKEIRLSKDKYSQFLQDKNRDIRKAAFEGMFGNYKRIQNTMSAALNAEVKKNIFFARSRKYKSALEASLSANGIPVSVYDNIIKSVNNNINSLHKYVKLRKDVLNVDKVHFYDMYVPLFDNYTISIQFEDAKKLLYDGLKPLGKDYMDNIHTAFDSKWIDVYEDENKYKGKYSWGTYDTHPYILLNYKDTADDMLTLSHELGHAMNMYYSNSTQPYINADAPIFTSNVASSTNEIIMVKYLLSKAKNNKEKLFLLNYLIENIRDNVFTQIMYAEFEKTIHARAEKGETLSAYTLNSIWKAIMQKYYGEEFAVDDLAAVWWSRVPHFYMNFYAYQYAVGMTAAYPLSQSLARRDKGAEGKYIQFLKAGGSDYPVELLKKAGVDMNSTKPLDELLIEFNRLIDEMERILIEEGELSK